MKRYKTLIVAGLLTEIFITSCTHTDQTKQTPAPVNVKVISLNAGESNSGTITYSGTIASSKAIDLSFQVGGTITSIPVENGQAVAKGQLLAALDETTYRNQYNAQLAQAKLAQENYQRVLEVFKKGSIAEIKMLEARSQYDQANSAAKATYQNIAHTRIFAPRAGYIGNKRIETGATASPGVPVLQLIDISSVEVAVPVPEAEINQYHKGDRANVTIEALSNKKIEGSISEVAVLASAGSPNYTVKIRLNNNDKQLKPGMACKVSFANATTTTATPDSLSKQLIIPAQAVQVDMNGKNFVYVASADGKNAVRKEIQTGSLYNNGIAVTNGLAGSDQLIISGYHKLTANSPIQIIK